MPQDTLPQTVGLLTFLLQKFIQTFTLGSALVIQDALGLLGVLTGLEIVLMGICFLYSRQLDLYTLVAKVVGVNVLAWIITAWPQLTRMVVNTFVYFGLKAGGDAISQTDFNDPSNIAQYGLNVAVVINAHLSGPDYVGTGALYNLREIILSGWLGIGIAILYFVLACWIFVVLLEFYGTTAFSVVLIPWGAFRLTAFLAEKTFAALCASGIQIMGLAFVTSAALPVMVSLQGGMHPTLGDLLTQLLGVMALLFLAWRIHKIAHVITSGSPQLTVNDVAQVVQTTVATINQTATTAIAMRDGMRAAASSAAAATSNLLSRRRS
jgi:type IV secretion system protein TrbL